MRAMPKAILALVVGSVMALSPAAARGQPADPPPREQPPKEQRGREVDLRPRYVQGRSTSYALTMNSTGTLTGKSIEPGDGDQDMRQEIGLRVFVEQADDSGAVVKVIYESIKVRLRSPIADVDFDSAAPDRKPAPGGLPDPIAEMLADGLRRAAGTVLTLRMDASGAITSVTGGETLDIGSSIGVPGIALPGGGGGQGLDWLAGGGGGGGPGVRRVGEQWTTTDRLSGTPVGAMSMSTTYHLRSASASQAKVAFTGRIDPPSMAPANPSAPAPSAAVGPSTYDGDYEWDLRAGELARMDSTMRVSMQTSASGDPVTMNSDVVMKVERREGRRPARQAPAPARR